MIVVDTINELVSEGDRIASEHVEVLTENPRYFLEKMTNYGALFLGDKTNVAYGDKVIGTNHTLPTSSFAKAYSGVSVDSFVKKITFQHITPDGIKNIGPTVEILAELEGLQAHKNAVSVRMK